MDILGLMGSRLLADSLVKGVMVARVALMRSNLALMALTR